MDQMPGSSTPETKSGSKLVWVIVIIVIVAAGLWWFTKNKANAPTPETTLPPSPEATTTP